MAQALRAAGVTLLSMGAAALAAACAFGLADRLWWSALGNGAGSLALAGTAARLFRAWVRHSPRHGGR